MKKLRNSIQELYQDRKQLIFLAAIFSIGAYLDSFIPRDPNVHYAWVGAALALVQTGIGIYQSMQGAKMSAANKRPEMDYQTPQEMLDALSDAEKKQFEGLPEEVRREFLQEMQRSSTSSLKQIQERRGGLGMISQLHQQEMDANRQLTLMDVAQREKNLANLQDMRTMMAGERTKAWQFERQDAMMQYTQAQETAAALQGAGTQNIMGGISTGVMAAGGGFASKEKEVGEETVIEGNKVPFESYSDLTRKPTPEDVNRYNKSVFKDKMTFEDFFAWEQKVKGFHKGGTVTGDDPNIEGEDVSAVLQEGEVVINADAAKENIGLLSQINQSTGGNPLQSYTMQTLASQGGGVGLSDDITIQLALDDATPPSEAALNFFSQSELETTGLPTSLVT